MSVEHYRSIVICRDCGRERRNDGHGRCNACATRVRRRRRAGAEQDRQEAVEAQTPSAPDLDAAIRSLRDVGQGTPCEGSEAPVSDSESARAYAAREMCTRCPIRDACFTAGLEHSWGVWGGWDTTRSRYPRHFCRRGHRLTSAGSTGTPRCPTCKAISDHRYLTKRRSAA